LFHHIIALVLPPFPSLASVAGIANIVPSATDLCACLLHLLAAASLSDFVGAAQDGVELELAAEY
jgi:hypothetical protein